MNTTSSYNWCNNRVNRAMAERYPHDFSICDVDGLVRCHYVSQSINKTRMILFESKYPHEKISDSQIKTLTEFSASVRWEKYDSMSGVYLIRYESENSIDVYRVCNDSMYYRANLSSMDRLYEWFSAKRNF